jgi:hypothetical protein
MWLQRNTGYGHTGDIVFKGILGTVIHGILCLKDYWAQLCNRYCITGILKRTKNGGYLGLRRDLIEA